MTREGLTLHSQCEQRHTNSFMERRAEEDPAAIARGEERVELVTTEVQARSNGHAQAARDQAGRALLEAQQERERRVQAEADAERERNEKGRAYRVAISSVAISLVLAVWGANIMLKQPSTPHS